ncbi:MAG: cell division protein FtsA [Chloroflexota bacterium]
MTKERVIVGVDVGTTKICALIGEVDHDNRVNVVGVGTVPSQGLRKGVVVDIDQATASIRAALTRTERISGYQIGTALVGIAGSHIESMNQRGVIAVSPTSHEISQADVDRVVEAARAVPVPHNREVIHVIPREYIVDGQGGISDPRGMSGYRLEVVTHIVTGAVPSIQNLIRCVRNAGIDIDDLVLEPIASSAAVLSQSERGLGVALVDIGGGTTDVAVFHEDGILYTKVLPVGGSHITNDLAIGLRTRADVAESIKLKYGHALAEKIDSTTMIDVPTFEAGRTEQVSRRLIAEIIEARAREMMEMVAAEIAKSGFSGVLPAGVVLTGGSSQLPGLTKLAEEILEMHVRVGVPSNVSGLVDSISTPAFATSVGLLEWGLHSTEPARDEPQRTSRRGVTMRRFRDLLRKFTMPADGVGGR